MKTCRKFGTLTFDTMVHSSHQLHIINYTKKYIDVVYLVCTINDVIRVLLYIGM